MKNKVLKSLPIAVLTISGFLGAVSCGGSKKPVVVPDGYMGTGIYYCETIDGEYLISFNKTESFTFTLNAITNSTGTYQYSAEDNSLSFLFNDNSQATATIQGDRLIVNYNDSELTFYKRTFFTVTYETNGGSTVKSQSVVNGKTVSRPEDPTRVGYKFMGWYEDETFENPFLFDAQPITENTTIYARFERAEEGQAEYEVKFAGVEGLENYTTIGGKLFDLPVPQKDGAKFAGWWLSANQDGEKLTAKYVGQVLTQNETLYAVWEDAEKPVVSVYADKVVWTAVGGNNTSYQVIIETPAGETISRTVNSATELAYDFANGEAGEYTVTVSVRNTAAQSQAYYTNKALDRVSLISVRDGYILSYEGVANAEKYYITVKCGDENHEHVLVDNGTFTSYNFMNCKMPAGGIKFIVTAVADGYVTSYSDEFTFSRSLEAVEGLAVDQQNGYVTWNKVENAESYVVQVTEGETVHTKVNVGNTDKFDVSAYTGNVKVQVYPTATGYYAPDATAVEYVQNRITAPTGIKIQGSTISWNVVEGATKYILKMGDAQVVVEDTTFTVPDKEWNEIKNATNSTYKISVTAVAEDEANNSYTTTVDARYAALVGGLKYKDGKVSWNYALGADTYVVQVNKNAPVEISDGSNEYNVNFSKTGYNTVKISYVDMNGEVSPEVTLSVYVYCITFDAQGGKSVSKKYYAAGDQINLPTTKYDGYDFVGWYKTPAGAQTNGAMFEETIFTGNADITLFAGYTSKRYDLTLNVGTGYFDTGVEEMMKVSFGKDFVLPIPKTNDSTKVFLGWYNEPNAQGVAYTDETGESTRKWNVADNRTLYAGWVDVLTYKFDAGTDGYIVKQNPLTLGIVTEVYVPEKYDDKVNGEKFITVIEKGAFKSATKLLSVRLPDTIQIVDESAFEGCTKLAAVDVYETAERVKGAYYSYDGVLLVDSALDDSGSEYGKYIFFYPSAKEGTYNIPYGVNTIKSDTFKGKKVTGVVIPASVSNVYSNAFNACTYVLSVVFKEGTEEQPAVESLTIETNAFNGCSKLDNVVLPKHLDVFEYSTAFSGCSKLKSLTVSEENAKYSTKDSMLCNKTGTELLYCPKGYEGNKTDADGVTYLEIPAGVTRIGDNAFCLAGATSSTGACTNITKVVIPEFVTYIGKNAFAYCNKITTLEFGANEDTLTPLTIDEQAFYGCSALESVRLPENIELIKTNAFGNCSKLLTVDVQVGKNAVIENLAFGTIPNKTTGSTSYYVTTLSLGKNVPAIEIAGIFGDKIVNIKIDSENTNYGVYTPGVDNGLTEQDKDVIFNSDLTEILYYPKGKTNTEYTIPTSVQTISANLFRNNVNIQKVTVTPQITTIGEYAFNGCTKLVEVIIENGDGNVDLTIKQNAFYGCSALTDIELPARTKVIENLAFSNCAKLEQIVIPVGVEKLGDYTADGEMMDNFDVFQKCNVMTKIIVEEGNTHFKAIDGVLYATDENGVPVALMCCPTACTGNENGQVIIPKTVSRIMTRAFYYNGYYVGGLKEIKGETLTAEEETAKGMNSVTLGADVFYYAKIEKISIPFGVSEIKRDTFYYNTALKELTLPKTVKTVAGRATYYCIALEKLTFEDGYITDSEGNILNELVIKDAYNEIVGATGVVTSAYGEYNYGAFAYSRALTEINFPERLVEIGSNAFVNCLALESVTIPKNVTRIGAGAFSINNGSGDSTTSYVSSLKSVIFEDGGTQPLTFDDAEYYTYTVKNGVVTKNAKATSSSQYGVFSYCKLLENLVIPERTTKLGSYMFNYNYKMGANGTINIPGGVSVLPDSLFSSCSSIKDVDIKDGVKTIGYNAFYGTSIESVKIPYTVTFIGNCSFYNCKNLKNVVFENTPEGEEEQELMIGDGTSGSMKGSSFYQCASLTNIVLPARLTSIWESSFYGCEKLTSVTFETDESGRVKLNNISKWAFRKTGLTEFAFPLREKAGETEQYITLGEQIFDSCKSLTSIYLSASINSIQGVFKGCSSIKSISVDPNSENFYAVENSPFIYSKPGEDGVVTSLKYICGSLSGEVVVPEGIEKIEQNTFAYQTGITKVVLPSTILEIDANAFEGCVNLKEVVFTSGCGLSQISNYVFNNCKQLDTITLPASVTEIGGYAFAGCTKLGTIDLGNVTKVGQYAFHGCENLENVLNTSNIEIYGTFAFAYCTKLKTFDLSGASTAAATAVSTSTYALGASLFRGCTALTDITVPGTVTNLGGGYLFAGCTALTSATFLGKIEKVASSGYYFDGCTALTEVNFEGGIDVLGSYMFRNCTALTSFEIPSGVKAIPASTFAGCTALEEITIPSTVTSISGANAFDGCTSLTSITFPSVLTAVGNYAFANCTSLTEVKLPSSQVIIGNYMFQNCTSLENITLPSTATKLGNYSFAGCTKLKEISLPNITFNSSETTTTSTTAFGVHAFDGCTSLAKVTFATNATAAGSAAMFKNCTSLEEVVIPKSVVNVYAYAFSGCTNLKTFKLSATGTTNIAFAGQSFQNCTSLATIGEGIFVKTAATQSFQNCTSLTDINTLISKATTLTSGCFDGCTGLTSVEISSTVTSITGGTFRNCSNLTELTVAAANTKYMSEGNIIYNKAGNQAVAIAAGIEGEVAVKEGVTSFVSYAFAGCSKITKIVLPSTLTYLLTSATSTSSSYTFMDCTALEEVEFKGAIANINGYAFQNCTSLKSIVLPDTLKILGSYAFAGSGLESVKFTSAVDIKENVFNGCVNLTNVELFEGITKLGTGTFQGCTSLENVVLPESVTELGKYCFANTAMKEVTVVAGVTYGDYVYADNTKLTNILFNEDVTTLGKYMFARCTALEDVVIPDTITSFHTTTTTGYTFQDCTALKKVTLGSGLTYINAYAFAGCSALEEVVMKAPEKIEAIYNYAFDGCSVLKTAPIGENVASIGQYVFRNCTSLTSVTMPETVTKIDNYAFFGCTALKTVVLNEGLDTIGGYTFQDCTALESINIPSTLRGLGSGASGYTFAGCTKLKSIVIPESVIGIAKCVFEGWTKDQTIYLETDMSSPNYGTTAFTTTPCFYLSTASTTTVSTAWHTGCDANIVWNYKA